MKKLHKRMNFFTLVEVLIAMGVCVIGICSIMVFFPIGANASRNAAMASYASNAATQLLNYAKSMIEGDVSKDDTMLKMANMDYLAFRYFTSSDSLPQNGWNPGNPSNYQATTKATPGPDFPVKEKLDDVLPSTASGVLNRVFGKSLNNTFDTFFNNGSTKVEYGDHHVYKFTFDGDNSDFDCFAALWAEPIPVDAGSSAAGNIPFAVRLKMEVSWPADIPYANRQKREYSIDVFKAY